MIESTLLVAYLSTKEHRATFLLRTYEPNQVLRLETMGKPAEKFGIQRPLLSIYLACNVVIREGKKGLTRLDIARRMEKQRDWETCCRTQKRRILRSNTLDLVDESKESLYEGETNRHLRSACRCVA